MKDGVLLKLENIIRGVSMEVQKLELVVGDIKGNREMKRMFY